MNDSALLTPYFQRTACPTGSHHFLPDRTHIKQTAAIALTIINQPFFLKSFVPLRHSDKLFLNYYSLTEISTTQTPRYNALLSSQFSVEPSMPHALKASSASLQNLLSIFVRAFLQSGQEKNEHGRWELKSAACSATQQVNSSYNALPCTWEVPTPCTGQKLPWQKFLVVLLSHSKQMSWQ